MRSFYSLSLVISVFLLSFSRCQAQRWHRREQTPARHRRADNLYGSFDAKNKRETNVAFTYFIDGLGACGATNGPNDMIVALNSADWDGGTHCFETITVTVNGKSAQAQISDMCPTCSPGGLDFSQGLFEYFAPTEQGQLQGSWTYGSGVTTSSSTPPPTSTSQTPTPTTTKTSTTYSASSVVSSGTTTTTTTSSTPTSTPTVVPTSQNPQIIAEANLALVEFGTLLEALFQLSVG